MRVLSFPEASAADAIWSEVVHWVAGWYRSMVPPIELRSPWSAGSQASRPAPGHELETSIASLAGSANGLREIRWRFPDRADETLIWSVESIVLPLDGTDFVLALRLASADFELIPARYQLRAPRVIREVVARGDAHVGVHQIGLDPVHVEPDGVPELTALLLEQSRRHPIVVVSPQPFTIDVYAIDPRVLAATLAGLASVYVVTRWAAYALTDEVGKMYSCYNGGVRVYWLRFDLAADRFAHPLWLPPQIREFGTSDGFARFWFRMIAGVASFRFVEPPAIRQFRTRVADARIAAIRTERTRDYDALFDEYARLDAEARDLRERLHASTTEIAALRADLARTWIPDVEPRDNRRGVEDDIRDPETVLQVVETARARTSHLVYLDDALDSARESQYRQPSKVLAALLAIDDVAGQWIDQLGGGPRLGARRDAFRQRGFDYKEDISPTSEGRWGEEYTYLYGGRRVLFAPHITIGAKGPDRCLSIHMLWDDARRKVVIAHVGRHKTNTKS